ncbi:hypothetical protein MTR67_022368 [Solanum verrucosum]|uniref:Uncharacterized protein n=1 Tax=Solanum verrucosum TaxID=315347 RepID=A0AAF0QV83_SOLVR|nr:hypothetical protein MTR67_022368 [Solanum verrucosum]
MLYLIVLAFFNEGKSSQQRTIVMWRSLDANRFFNLLHRPQEMPFDVKTHTFTNMTQFFVPRVSASSSSEESGGAE